MTKFHFQGPASQQHEAHLLLPLYLLRYAKIVIIDCKSK